MPKFQMFRMKKLSLACGIALSGLAGNAAAVNVDLFISGATAQDVNLAKAVSDLCLNNANKIRINTTGAGVGSTYKCDADPATSGLAAGDTLVISKQTTGGSANGVKPVNDGLATLVGGAPNSMLRPQTSQVASGCTGPTVGAAPWTTVYTCTSNAGAAAPHAGLSDVEPSLLALSGDIGNLAPVGTVAVQFAPAISTELYKKLQAQQGLIVGDFTEAQAPTLHPADVRGILNATIADWSQIVPGITPNPVAAGITTEIKLCRRGTTSGTQKTFETRLFNAGTNGTNPGCNGSLAPGNGALNPVLGNNDDATPLNDGVQFSTGTALNQGGYRGRTDAYTVVVNSGASDVQQCLITADGQGEMAIGLLSTEVTPPANWKFPKMGGIFPNRQSLVDGGWDQLWSQATFQRRIAPAGAAPAYLAGQTTVMNKLQTLIGDPANILALALNGVAALPSNGFTWTGLAANPVMRGERRSTGGVVNNCQEALTQ